MPHIPRNRRFNRTTGVRPELEAPEEPAFRGGSMGRDNGRTSPRGDRISPRTFEVTPESIAEQLFGQAVEVDSHTGELRLQGVGTDA